MRSNVPYNKLSDRIIRQYYLDRRGSFFTPSLKHSVNASANIFDVILNAAPKALLVMLSKPLAVFSAIFFAAYRTSSLLTIGTCLFTQSEG